MQFLSLDGIGSMNLRSRYATHSASFYVKSVPKDVAAAMEKLAQKLDQKRWPLIGHQSDTKSSFGPQSRSRQLRTNTEPKEVTVA